MNIFFYIGVTLLGAYLIFLGPNLQPDTGSYMSYNVARSPLYPLLLKGYMSVFGTNFTLLISLQIMAVLFSIHLLTLRLRQLFKIHDLTAILVFAILCAPCFFFAGRFILTESLCYPLFLLLLAFLIKGVLSKNSKDIVISFALSGLLLMTRTQFLFLYPFFIVLIGYLSVRDRHLKSTVLLTLALLGTLVSANLLERTYHYVHSGRFSGVSFVGVQMINAPLYVAESTDKEIFQDKDERAFFEEVHQRMRGKSVTKHSIMGYMPQARIIEHIPMVASAIKYMPMARHFEWAYNTICHQTVSPAASKHFKGTTISIDSKLTSISLKLIFHKFIEWFQLYVSLFVYGFGGKWFLTLACSGFLLACVHVFDHKKPLAPTYALFFTLAACNLLLVNLVEPPMSRYTFYTHMPLLAYFFILLEKAFSRRDL